MTKTRNIGVEVKQPEKECNDKHCPFHGEITLHGRIFEGTVKSAKAHKTAVVQWDDWIKVKKYERFERTRTKISAHVPDCLIVKEGDKVKLMESRPISKTKNFIIIEVFKK